MRSAEQYSNNSAKYGLRTTSIKTIPHYKQPQDAICMKKKLTREA